MQAIAHWNPEDPAFWQSRGRRVAARNAWISGAALLVAYAVWMLWPALAAQLPAAGFRYTLNQRCWLAAVPALSGATLRLFFAFGVPAFGGRRWTAMTMAGLLLPVAGTALAVQDPSTPFEVMLGLALLCGLGGASFASTMAHIADLYPGERVGGPLSLNAGLGNVGLVLAQLAVPLAVAAAPLALGHAALLWMPLIAAAAAAAWFGMDDLAGRRNAFAEQAVIVLRRHNWLMSWLYLGSFGSFLGYTAAFPLLLPASFPGLDPLPLVWLGPLLGAALRPLGARLGERLGGARVTLWSFAALAAGTLGAIAAVHAGRPGLFVAAFGLLFAAAGVGCGSTFGMIPRLFAAPPDAAAALTPAEATRERHAGQVEARAALGFASAVGAYGGFVIPKALGSSLQSTGSPEAALWVFLAFYLSCLAITWWHYARRYAPMPC